MRVDRGLESPRKQKKDIIPSDPTPISGSTLLPSPQCCREIQHRHYPSAKHLSLRRVPEILHPARRAGLRLRWHHHCAGGGCIDVQSVCSRRSLGGHGARYEQVEAQRRCLDRVRGFNCRPPAEVVRQHKIRRGCLSRVQGCYGSNSSLH